MQGPVDSGPGPSQPSPPAERRRRLWAQSKDSLWQQSSPNRDQDQDLNLDHNPDQDLSQEPGPGSAPHNGRVPNKISSWLSECRTPIGASLDEHSGSPSRGLRNGCSFEDDLSLGAEANHLQSSPSRSEPGFGLAANQKRSQFKERAQSMNSTGSGKSSTVSSVSELLDLYEEDPEEILLNLGFGREEPDLASKVPSRFFNNSSCARGIDFKVFLGAQLQRLELENPNYALTSRFRQIEVLTTVANEFFQLYSQVSGQPLHRITPRDSGVEGEAKDPPPLKKSASALNAAKLLKKTITRHNLLASASSGGSVNSLDSTQTQISTDTPTSTDANGHASTQANGRVDTPGSAQASDHANMETGSMVNVEANTQVSSQVSSHDHGSLQNSDTEEPPRPKLKMDITSLSTVSEESSSEGEAELDAAQRKLSTDPANQTAEEVEMTNESRGEVEQTANHDPGGSNSTSSSRTEQVERTSSQSAEVPEQSTLRDTEEAELQTASGKTDVGQTTNHNAGEVEKSANDRAVHPQLALLRTENADSFDIEEIHSSEDDVVPQRGSRISDLSRTVSLQSDSSGFAEEPSSESCSSLKVQESSDSCDSETTVTSHPSQDLATPLAADQPAFALLTGDMDDTDDSVDSGDHSIMDVIPQYTAHHLPKNQSSPPEKQSSSVTGQAEETVNIPNSEPDEGQLSQIAVEGAPETPLSDSTLEDNGSESLDLETSRPRSAESPDFVSDSSDSCLLPAPPSPVLSALNRAKLHQKLPGGGTGRLRCVPLQRSSSLPTTVVSSVRIQLGRGKASCTQQQYSQKPQTRDEVDSRSTSHTPLRAIPRHLMMTSSRSVCSSPPPEWQMGGSSPSWSTQSVPELFTHHHHQHHHQLQQNVYQPPPPVSYPQAPPLSYPYATPYGSLPNLCSPQTSVSSPYPSYPQHSMSEYSSRTAPHPAMNFSHGTPHTPMSWFGGSSTNLHSPNSGNFSSYSGPSYGTPSPSLSRYGSFGHLYHPGSHPHTFMSETHPPHPLHPHPPQTGFNLGPSSSPLFGAFSPETFPPHHPVSSSEVQLRRVLQDIRGTLHSLGQGRFGATDVLSERRPVPASPQSVSELLLKRRSLNDFRSQMMELELSIVKEQAQVYRHLSPSDRLEVEQLQRLRTAVREELQELEQQLEERLMELTPPTRSRLQRGSSEENMSSSSALRAMEPVSDLLREQLLLHSELSYHSNRSTPASSGCSSPIRRTPTPTGAGLYRASINITPVPPPRQCGATPQPCPSDDQGAESHRTEDMPTEQGRGQDTTAMPPVGNLQQLIREIRQSVAEEVRREIYSELLASINPTKPQL